MISSRSAVRIIICVLTPTVYVSPVAGRYRITVTGAAYQPRSSVTMSLKRQNDIQGDSELFAAWDVDEKIRTVSTIKYMRDRRLFLRQRRRT